MKSIPLHLLVVLGLALACARAQEGADPYKKSSDKPQPAAKAPEQPAPPQEFMIQTTVEWIEVAIQDAALLLREGLAPNSAELIEKIRTLEKTGKATVVDTISALSRNGQRAATEGTKEFIYPTEFNPAQTPKLKELDLSGNQIKEPRLALATEAHATAQPTAFTMRPLGARMETEASIGEEGRFIELNLAPEITRLAGNQAFGVVRIGGENVPSLEQPLFVTSKVQTALMLRSGETVLAGVTTAFNDDGEADRAKKWLVLIRAVTVPVR